MAASVLTDTTAETEGLMTTLKRGIPKAGERRVLLMPETKLDIPEMWLEVYIHDHPMVARSFYEMFARAKCTKQDDPMKADIVVFTGGADLNPALYGEDKHHQTKGIDDARDRRDMDMYLKCVENGIPMFGVCRGAQFLHVMNGGKLFQHVDKHYGDHGIYDHDVREYIQTSSSTHHQACRANTDNGMHIIATSSVATERWANPKEVFRGGRADIEAYFYRDTCCLGVQGHPEYRGYPKYQAWTLNKIYNYIACNPDVSVQERKYRIKPEILDQRRNNWQIVEEKVEVNQEQK